MILHHYKIVFGGSMGAGKSSAIKALSDIEVLSTEVKNTDSRAHEKLQTTVGIDYGEINLEDQQVIGLYGTPGQDRFDFMWPLICKGAIGTIILLDHSKSNVLEDLEYYLRQFEQYTLDNIVIGITHIDHNRAVSANIYHDWLIERDLSYPLYFVDARKKDDILLMVETLLSCAEVSALV